MDLVYSAAAYYVQNCKQMTSEQCFAIKLTYLAQIVRK